MLTTTRFKFALVGALVWTLLYFGTFLLRDYLLVHPTFSGYAPRFIREMTTGLQMVWTLPLGPFMQELIRHVIVFPQAFLIFYALGSIYKKYRRFWQFSFVAGAVILTFLYCFPNSLLVFENEEKSLSQGQVWNGAVKYSKRMPFQGDNFTTYSFLGYLLGRTHVHEKVKKVVLDAYEICEQTCHAVDFVLAETGWPWGGRFLPHRTHQNGTSVDFLTPFLKNGIPSHRHGVQNVWGYAIELDQEGRDGEYEIDYATMVKHLLALKESADKNGVRISKIIFDPVLQPRLFSSSGGEQLRQLPFTSRRVAIRHDDHYHVDFSW
jgi:penicillin-insensitive murein endopeptidase